MLYCGEGVPMNTQVRPADDDDPKWAVGWTSMANLKTAIFLGKSLEIMVSKGNHPQMALIQVSELL